MSIITDTGVPNAVRAVFTSWLVSDEHTNRTRFTEERYLEYKTFLIFPNSKLPHDLKDKEHKQRWSNQKCDALLHYEVQHGVIYRKASGKYPQR